MERINKRQARRAFEQGKEIWVVPCNMDVKFGMLISKEYLKKGYRSFDHIINNYVWFNCNNETGRYCAYYLDE